MWMGCTYLGAHSVRLLEMVLKLELTNAPNVEITLDLGGLPTGSKGPKDEKEKCTRYRQRYPSVLSRAFIFAYYSSLKA